MLELHELVKPAVFAPSLWLDDGHQRLNAHDVHDAGEIIGEYVQCHLGGDLWQSLHQKVRGARPHLQCREGMLSCLASLAHRLRVLIETLLHGSEHVIVLPPFETLIRLNWSLRPADESGDQAPEVEVLDRWRSLARALDRRLV
jgi:hypothetical protein